MEALILDGKSLTLEALHEVVYDRRPVRSTPQPWTWPSAPGRCCLTWPPRARAFTA